jgi:hypothetical protein
MAFQANAMLKDSFERYLQTLSADFTFNLPGSLPQETWDFYLNPRYLRGSDFLMRWSQGLWSEQIVVDAIRGTNEFVPLPYGPSGVAPEDPKELEAYFERLNAAKQIGKRPDLLIFSKTGYDRIAPLVASVGLENIPFTPEAELKELLRTAIIAAEVENSLWVGKDMPHFGKGKPIKGFPDLIGFARSHKVPTIIVKKEDVAPLKAWQDQ